MSAEQRDREMMYPALDHEFFNFLESKDALVGQTSKDSSYRDSHRQAMEAIYRASREEFLDFLGDLSQDRRRHRLPQDIVTALMDRGFSLAEEEVHSDKEPRGDFDGLVYQLERAIQLSGDFKRRDKDDESLTDRAFRASLGLYYDHPESVEKLFSQMTQEYTVRPDIFMAGVADMMWRPEVSRYFKTDAIHGVNYLLSFDYHETYQRVMVDNIDFENPENFFKTATFLEFIKRVYQTSQDFDFSEDKAGRQLKKTLEQAVSSPKNTNYLLHARAAELLAAITAGEEWFVDQDRRPFLVEPGVYGFDFGEGLRLSDPKNAPEVAELLEELREVEQRLTPPQWMIDEAIKRGENFVQWQAPDHFMDERDRAWKRLSFVIDQPISTADVVVDRQAVHDSNLAEEKRRKLFDFSYLMSKPVRQKIEADFSIKLGDVSLREKFYFLDFLKTITNQDVDKVKNFVRQFGHSGIRAFLSMEQGQESSGDIFTLGEKFDPEVAQAIFNKYGELVDAADVAADYVQENFAAAPGYQPDVADQIRHNLLVRGRQLLQEYAASRELDLADAMAKLSSVKGDVLLFTAAFKEISARQETVDWNEIKNVSLVDTAAPTMVETATMEEIIRKNYRGNPLLDGVLAGWRTALEEANNTWYLLKRDDEIISFYRFHDLPIVDNESAPAVEFASFNTDSDYQHGGIGRAIMTNAIRERGRERVIVASTDPFSQICQFYVQQAGFVIDGVEPYKDTGISVFHIRVDQAARYEPVGEVIDLGDRSTMIARVAEITSAGQVLDQFYQDKTTGHFIGRAARPVGAAKRAA